MTLGMRLLIFASISVVGPAAALGHDTWLVPNRFHLRAPSPVTLSLTSGMEFPALETAIKPDRIAIARVRTARGDTDLKTMHSAEHALNLSVRLRTAGVAVFWVSLNPRSLELQPDEVRHYLEEIDAPPPVQSAWEASATKRWQESYVKHAKTFVRAGSTPGGGEHWASPVGMNLEFIPEQDPTQARAGDRLTFLLLEKGQPLAGQAAFVVREGGTEILKRTTDQDGRIGVVMPRPGKYMIRSTVLRKSEQPEIDWESDFTTLTLSVLEGR